MAQAEKVNLPAMEDVMYRWLSENANSIHDGGCGDVSQLYSCLMAAAAKSPISLLEKPNSFWNPTVSEANPST